MHLTTKIDERHSYVANKYFFLPHFYILLFVCFSNTFLSLFLCVLVYFYFSLVFSRYLSESLSLCSQSLSDFFLHLTRHITPLKLSSSKILIYLRYICSFCTLYFTWFKTSQEVGRNWFLQIWYLRRSRYESWKRFVILQSP